MTYIWVMDGNILLFISIVVDDAFGKNVKWLTQKNVISRQLNDVNLKIKCELINEERYIAG